MNVSENLSMPEQFDAVLVGLNSGVYSKDYNGGSIYELALEQVRSVKACFHDESNFDMHSLMIYFQELYTTVHTVLEKLEQCGSDEDTEPKDALVDKLKPTKFNLLHVLSMREVSQDENSMAREITKLELHPIFASGAFHAFCLVFDYCIKSTMTATTDTTSTTIANVIINHIISLWQRLALIPYDTYDDDMNQLPLLIYYLTERHLFGTDIAWNHSHMLMMPLFLSSCVSAFDPKAMATVDEGSRRNMYSLLEVVLAWYPKCRLTPKINDLTQHVTRAIMKSITQDGPADSTSHIAIRVLPKILSFGLPHVTRVDMSSVFLMHFLTILSSSRCEDEASSGSVQYERCSCSACEWRRCTRKEVVDNIDCRLGGLVLTTDDIVNIINKMMMVVTEDKEHVTHSAVLVLFMLMMIEGDRDNDVAPIVPVLSLLFHQCGLQLACDTTPSTVLIECYSSLAAIVMKLIYDVPLAKWTPSDLAQVHDIARDAMEMTSKVMARDCNKESSRLLPLYSSLLLITVTIASQNYSSSLQSLKELRVAKHPLALLFFEESKFKQLVDPLITILQDIDVNRLSPPSAIYRHDLLAASSCLIHLFSGQYILNTCIRKHFHAFVSPPNPMVGALRLHTGFLEGSDERLELPKAEDHTRADNVSLGDSIIQERRNEFNHLVGKAICPLSRRMTRDSLGRIEKVTGMMVVKES